MKLKTIIVDDEQLSIDLLRSILTENCPQIDIAGEATSIEDGIKLCKKLNPDLLLLDIEILGGTGFEILEAIPKRTFHTIFVTAHEKYAIKALKSRAFDYILKPVDKEEI